MTIKVWLELRTSWKVKQSLNKMETRVNTFKPSQGPRCFKPKDLGRIGQPELHHFVDASQEHVYGTVSYLRFVNERGEIHCSFVMDKLKVKPLNKVATVPNLELTAATLATRISYAY